MKPVNRALNGALKGIISLGLTRAKKHPAPALYRGLRQRPHPAAGYR